MKQKRGLITLFAIALGLSYNNAFFVDALEDTCSLSLDAESFLSQEHECKGDYEYGSSNFTYEEQLEKYLANPNYSAEQKEQFKAAVKKAIFERDNPPSPKAMNFANITIPVPSYAQLKNYYCGPATTKQTLQYIGNHIVGSYNSPHQYTIASALGTEINQCTFWEDIQTYLNGYVFAGVAVCYLEHTPSSNYQMEAGIHSALNAHHPPILHISTFDSTGYGNGGVLGYETHGHYLNASGYKSESNFQYYRVTDPERARLGYSPAAIWVKTTTIYNFTINHPYHHYLS